MPTFGRQYQAVRGVPCLHRPAVVWFSTVKVVVTRSDGWQPEDVRTNSGPAVLVGAVTIPTGTAESLDQAQHAEPVRTRPPTATAPSPAAFKLKLKLKLVLDKQFFSFAWRR